MFIRELLEQHMYNKFKVYDISYTYGGLEKSFIKLLNMFKLPYHIIGHSKQHLGVERFPCIMETEEIEKQNPHLPKKYEA